MKIVQWASVLHKWLALFVGVQIVIWVGTGLFFAIVPIEQVRSEHRQRELTPAPLATADLSVLGRIFASGEAAPVKLTLEQRPEGAVALAEFADARPLLFDARTGARLSPLSAAAAERIARARIDATAPLRRAQWVTQESPEYRNALPAWRIEFDEPGRLAIYVSADTGLVTARRSDLWRLYDALWALHIMDWRDHENFNHGLIIAASALSLITLIAGVVLFPYRLRLPSRKKASPA